MGFLGPDVWFDGALRVLVVDDVELDRRRLVVALESDPNVEVVGEAATLEQARAKAAAIPPSVTVMTLTLGDVPAVETVEAVLEVAPHTRVLALVTPDDQRSALAAIRVGAVGTVVRDGSRDVALAAVRALAAGESVLDDQTAADVLAEVDRLAAGELVPGEEAAPIVDDLARQVLAGRAAGTDVASLSARLDLDEHRVGTHLDDALAALQRQVAEREAATRAALVSGLRGLRR